MTRMAGGGATPSAMPIPDPAHRRACAFHVLVGYSAVFRFYLEARIRHGWRTSSLSWASDGLTGASAGLWPSPRTSGGDDGRVAATRRLRPPGRRGVLCRGDVGQVCVTWIGRASCRE